MTQWLIEEAAFTALDLFDARAQRSAMEDSSREARLEGMAMKALGR